MTIIQNYFRMGTRHVNWWTASSHVSLLDVLRVLLLAGEQHPTPFHRTSVPGENKLACFNHSKMHPYVYMKI